MELHVSCDATDKEQIFKCVLQVEANHNTLITAKQRLFKKTFGTMGLSCLMSVDRAYRVCIWSKLKSVIESSVYIHIVKINVRYNSFEQHPRHTNIL